MMYEEEREDKEKEIKVKCDTHVMGTTTGILFVLIRKAIGNLDASCNLEKNAQYW